MAAVMGAWYAVGASPGVACSVCYGAAENDWIGGARLAAIFMLGLTYTLLGAGVLAVVTLRKNLKKDERSQ